MSVGSVRRLTTQTRVTVDGVVVLVLSPSPDNTVVFLVATEAVVVVAVVAAAAE